MNFNDYLNDLLGKDTAKDLRKAIRQKKVIIIGGTQEPTGKSTLKRLLQKRGAAAYEGSEVVYVLLNKPLESVIPDFEEQVEV